jgi:hypothetical protein
MLSCLTCASCTDITGIAVIALAALELSGDAVHEPVHAHGLHPRVLYDVARLPERFDSFALPAVSRSSGSASHLNSYTLTSHVVRGRLDRDDLDALAVQVVGQPVISFIVAVTDQTRAPRLPGRPSSGTQVQTTPLALAT